VARDPLSVAAAAVRAVADVQPESARPALIGQLYEAELAPEARSAGAHYTPVDVAERLVALVIPEGELLMGAGGAPGTVWDPACGGGAFLLAAADALLRAGHPPDVIVGDMLWGTDMDPGAIAVTDAALRMWGNLHGVDIGPKSHLAVGDALLDRSDEGPLARARDGGFDVVIGNPPFQGQMVGSSIRSGETATDLRRRFGPDVVRPYTDTSALFLVAGAEALAPGGRLLMILPTSVLAARDASAARDAAVTAAGLTGLWVATELVFDAFVQVCAVVLERSAKAAPRPQQPAVRRWRGRSVELLPSADGHTLIGTIAATAATEDLPGEAASRWAPYALAAVGVPDPTIRWSGRLGSLGTARAGFRDEYYGLVGHVSEAPEDVVDIDEVPAGYAPLVTSGLIDPGRCWWGERTVVFARARYQRPVVDRAGVADGGGRAASWAAGLAVPKVVVATQTRVGEAAVDLAGTWLASTPTVAVIADPARLWEIAAVVCSPVGSVVALALTAGSARSLVAIRHRVSSVSALPLPIDRDAWLAGSDALQRGDQSSFAEAMAAAYAVEAPGELEAWWTAAAPWP